MGFYSCTCAKTQLPVLAGMAWGDTHTEMCEVVVLFENGDKIDGIYDGYGRVGAFDLNALLFPMTTVKFVLKKFYAGEKFGDLGLSFDEPKQGFFHKEDFLVKIYAEGGFPNFATYLLRLSMERASDLGNVGDVIQIAFERHGVNGVEAFEVNGIIEYDIVVRGGVFYPGLVVTPGCMLSDFEAEWIGCAVNEGSCLEAETEPEEDGSFVRFKILSNTATPVAVILLPTEENEWSAYLLDDLAKVAGCADGMTFFAACSADKGILRDTASRCEPAARANGKSFDIAGMEIKETLSDGAVLFTERFI